MQRLRNLPIAADEPFRLYDHEAAFILTVAAPFPIKVFSCFYLGGLFFTLLGAVFDFIPLNDFLPRHERARHE